LIVPAYGASEFNLEVFSKQSGVSYLDGLRLRDARNYWEVPKTKFTVNYEEKVLM
jgi:hypothetical protein